jgi:hypothetical protein
MATHATQALELIRDTLAFLKESSSSVLASPEEAAFFRQKYKAPVRPAPAVFAKPISLPKPAPLPEPAPIVLTPKAPPPEPTFVPTPKPPQPTILGTIFHSIAPDFPILKEPPSDAMAKKISSRWKTHNQIAPITLLHFQEIPEQKVFLENLIKALDVYFGPARLVSAELVEKENQWDAFLSVPELKMVIACDHTLWQLPHLREKYKEIPTQEKRLLKEKPLFLLPDLALYLKDPLLKRSLWKGLCLTLRSLPSFSTKT